MDGNVLQSESNLHNPAMIAPYVYGALTLTSALSPTAPFPKEKPRLVLASVLAAGLAVSLFTTSAMVMKGTTAGIGLGFFTDPLLWRGLDYLNKNYPNWQKLLEIRK